MIVSMELAGILPPGCDECQNGKLEAGRHEENLGPGLLSPRRIRGLVDPISDTEYVPLASRKTAYLRP